MRRDLVVQTCRRAQTPGFPWPVEFARRLPTSGQLVTSDTIKFQWRLSALILTRLMSSFGTETLKLPSWSKIWIRLF
jgi:hypothetical protein